MLVAWRETGMLSTDGFSPENRYKRSGRNIKAMLTSTREKLDALYAGGKHRGTDGKLHKIDTRTRISFEQGETLARIHNEIRPRLSVEIGMAYGFSTLFFLDAMREGRYGRHVAIDPFQVNMWHGIGLNVVRNAGLAGPFGRFRWISERSALALSVMQKKKQRAQFVYVDGSHLFDDAILDISLADKILDIGGVVAIDDLYMPAVRQACAFVTSNMPCYESVDTGCKNLAAFHKVAWDARPWDHYVEF